MIKLVVFDWNGTILSDTESCRVADNHVLQTFGSKSVNLSEFRNTFTIPAINFYIHHGCNKETLLEKSKQVAKIFHSSYESRAAKCRTRKGTKKLLEWLQNNSISAVILSNHTVEGIKSQLDRLKLTDYFSKILANTDLDTAMKQKNKEEKLGLYLEAQRNHLSEVIIIGDSPEEVHIGQRFGIRTIAITNGYYSTSRLRESKPDYLIDRLDKIIEIIKSGY